MRLVQCQAFFLLFFNLAMWQGGANRTPQDTTLNRTTRVWDWRLSNTRQWLVRDRGVILPGSTWLRHGFVSGRLAMAWQSLFVFVGATYVCLIWCIILIKMSFFSFPSFYVFRPTLANSFRPQYIYNYNVTKKYYMFFVAGFVNVMVLLSVPVTEPVQSNAILTM